MRAQLVAFNHGQAQFEEIKNKTIGNQLFQQLFMFVLMLNLACLFIALIHP